jgi:hypothetical protein
VDQRATAWTRALIGVRRLVSSGWSVPRVVVCPAGNDPHDHQLVARHSGKCVDVSGISTAAGARVHQWTCNPAGQGSRASVKSCGSADLQLVSCRSSSRASILLRLASRTGTRCGPDPGRRVGGGGRRLPRRAGHERDEQGRRLVVRQPRRRRSVPVAAGRAPLRCRRHGSTTSVMIRSR